MAQKICCYPSTLAPLSTHCVAAPVPGLSQFVRSLCFPYVNISINQKGKTSTNYSSPSTLWYMTETSSNQRHGSKGLSTVSSVKCRVLVANLVKHNMSSLTANWNHPKDCNYCSQASSSLNISHFQTPTRRHYFSNKAYAEKAHNFCKNIRLSICLAVIFERI